MSRTDGASYLLEGRRGFDLLASGPAGCGQNAVSKLGAPFATNSGSAQMAVPPQFCEWKGLSCSWEELAVEINNFFATIKAETSVSSSR